MPNEITVNSITYGIEGDHYDGDLLLTSTSGTHVIKHGYTGLKSRAFDLGCNLSRVSDFIEDHIEEYIKANFETAEFVEP